MKDSLKYYALVYIIFLVALVVMGSMYINDLPNVMHEKIGGLSVAVKDTAMDSTKQTADLPTVKGTLSPPVDVMKFMTSTPDMVDKGKALYTMNCVSCHGEQGKGDGVAGVNLNPKPRNFHEMTGWTNGPALTMIYKTLHEGITNRGMASYANLPPEERLNLIMYIRTLNPGYPPITQVQLDSIDAAYSLTKGVKQPNQIPVKLAMEKILQQGLSVDRRAVNMVKAVEENKTDTGAVILKSISEDLTKALIILALDSSWNNNEAALVKIFDTNPLQNGFKARASYTLNQQQLSSLHAYLRKLFASVV
jgi:mono/diheme cytochrome c family protein